MPTIKTVNQTNVVKKHVPIKLNYDKALKRYFITLDLEVKELNKRLFDISPVIRDQNHIKTAGGCSSLDGIQLQLVNCFNKLKDEDPRNLPELRKDISSILVTIHNINRLQVYSSNIG